MSDSVDTLPAISPRKHSRQCAFLKQYPLCLSVRHACKAARIAFTTHYTWLRTDPAYRRAFEEVEQQLVDVAEGELKRRGIVGTKEPVFFNGQQCGETRKYSDACLIAYLKAHRPEKYRESAGVMVGGDGAMIQIVMQRLPDTQPTLMDGEAKEIKTDEQGHETNLLEAAAQAS